MSFKKGYLFFVGVLIILGGLFTWDSIQSKKDKAREESKNRLSKIDFEKIKSIEFSNANIKDLLLVQSKEGWKIQKPVEENANETSVKELYDAFNYYRYERLLDESDAKWQDYGLKEPSVKVRFTMTDDSTSTYVLGKPTVNNANVYMAHYESRKTFLTSKHNQNKVDQKLFDFRIKDIFKIQPQEIDELSYSSSEPTRYTLKKQGVEFVVVESSQKNGLHSKIDSEKVIDYLTDLSFFKVAGYKDQNLKSFSKDFERSKVRYTIKVKLGKTELLRRFAIVNNVLWVELGTEKFATVEEHHKPKIRKNLEDFMSKRMFDFLPEDVHSLKVNDKSLDPKNEGAPLVVDLSNAEYAKTLQAKSNTLKPDYKLALKVKGKDLEVQFWSDKKQLRHSNSDTIYVVGDELVNSIKSTASGAFKAKEELIP